MAQKKPSARSSRGARPPKFSSTKGQPKAKGKGSGTTRGLK